MIYLCTFFDYRYADRGLALHRSLMRQGQPFHLWILCMDPETLELLRTSGLSNVSLLTIDDLGRHDQAVHIARGNRSLVEFYFTSKSFLCQYVFDLNAQVDLLTYLDADCYFFGSPAAISAEMDGYSVGLTPHRFPPHLREAEQYGLYNAGFISIRRDGSGLACLAWWRKNCYDWCRDYVSEGRFADQGYLDAMPGRFPNVRVITNKGINAAPWNVSQFKTETNDGSLVIDKDGLVLYHFHGVKRIGRHLYDSGFSGYRNVMSRHVRASIYRPYVAELIMHTVPERSNTGMKDIRIIQGKYDRLRTVLPVAWNILNVLRTIARGFRYHSLIITRN